MIICPTCGKATRIGHAFDDKGTKHRACKKCGAFMDGEKKARAKKEVKKDKEPAAKKVEKAEEKATKAAPKKTAPKATKSTADKADKAASTTRRKAPAAKSQGK